MQKILLLVLIVSFTLFNFGCKKNHWANIEGVISSQKTGLAISKANIKVDNQNEISNEDGQYQLNLDLEGLVANIKTIEVSANNYLSQKVDTMLFTNEAGIVSLNFSLTPKDFLFFLNDTLHFLQQESQKDLLINVLVKVTIINQMNSLKFLSI